MSTAGRSRSSAACASTQAGNSVERRMRGSSTVAPPAGGAKAPMAVSLALRTSMMTAPGVLRAISSKACGERCVPPRLSGASASAAPRRP